LFVNNDFDEFKRTQSSMTTNRRGAENEEEAQRINYPEFLSLRFLSVLCASAARWLS
jgi:hypothetical protein